LANRRLRVGGSVEVISGILLECNNQRMTINSAETGDEESYKVAASLLSQMKQLADALLGENVILLIEDGEVIACTRPIR
jgi:hypothetical protein